MPVGGYDHKRVWQWRFLSPSVSLLDRGWDHDRQWERSVIEQLRRGGPAPSSLSTSEAIPSLHYPHIDGGGWEDAEHHARNAIRTGSAFLSDEAIARRKAGRDVLKQAYDEMLAEQRARWEAGREAREAEAAAKAEAHRAWVLARARRAAREDEREREWAEAEAEREIARRERAEAVQAREAEKRAQFYQDRADEVKRILAHNFECKSCGVRAEITPRCIDAERAIWVYAMQCGCNDREWYHDDLLRMLPR